jgi:hypothetical protein
VIRPAGRIFQFFDNAIYSDFKDIVRERRISWT